MNGLQALISDNGPCYTSQAFTSFMQSCTVLIILPALCITHNRMVLLRSMSRLWKACSTKQRKKAKIFSSVWWYIAIPPVQVVCSHLCRFLKAGVLYLTCPYQMLLENSCGIQPEIVRNTDTASSITYPWSICRSASDVSRFHKQALVPSSYCKFMFWTKKLQDNYKRWYCLQKNPI